MDEPKGFQIERNKEVSISGVAKYFIYTLLVARYLLIVAHIIFFLALEFLGYTWW